LWIGYIASAAFVQPAGIQKKDSRLLATVTLIGDSQNGSEYSKYQGCTLFDASKPSNWAHPAEEYFFGQLNNHDRGNMPVINSGAYQNPFDQHLLRM